MSAALTCAAKLMPGFLGRLVKIATVSATPRPYLHCSKSSTISVAVSTPPESAVRRASSDPDGQAPGDDPGDGLLIPCQAVPVGARAGRGLGLPLGYLAPEDRLGSDGRS